MVNIPSFIDGHTKYKAMLTLEDLGTVIIFQARRCGFDSLPILFNLHFFQIKLNN